MLRTWYCFSISKSSHHQFIIAGAKLCYISDLLEGQGSVTGVDIGEARLSTCRTLCRKYSCPNVRLFLHDGCTFSVLSPQPLPEGVSSIVLPEIEDPQGEVSPAPLSKKTRKGRRKKKTAKDAEDLVFASNWQHRSASWSLYDRVVCDAQCSLDASVRHLLQYQKVGWRVLDPNLASTMATLQRRLIANAYRLLKPGGVLVYSTCSFSRRQNEEVVQWLLDSRPGAVTLPITESAGSPSVRAGIEHTLRYYPRYTGTSGMFIAKIGKPTDS